MAKTLTGANSRFALSITNLYNAPQSIQGYAADDVFDSEMVKAVETLMGVDGKLSAGFVNIEKKMGVMLQADSDSNDIFDNWFQAQETQSDTYIANGTVYIQAIGMKFALTRGFLTGYTYMPAVKKIIQPRKYEITWNRIGPAPA